VDESACAVELWQVKCRIGGRDEPHGLDDIGFEWTYHDEGEGQLAIGLGGVVGVEEVCGLKSTDGEEEMEWYGSDYEDDDGIGGF
jgi:hypothetical protein